MQMSEEKGREVGGQPERWTGREEINYKLAQGILL